MSTKMSQLDSGASDLVMPTPEFSSQEPAQPSEPAPVPEASPVQEAPAPEPDLGNPDWFDEDDTVQGGSEPEGQQEYVDQPEQAQSPQTESSSAEVSIDAFKKEHKFKLDPEDAALRRTLRRGLKAPKIKEELDKTAKEFKELQANFTQAKEAQEVWNELKSLADEGQYERVIHAVLGDKYQEVMDKLVNRTMEYQEADPGRRAELDRERLQHELAWNTRQKDSRIKELENTLSSGKEQAELDKMESYTSSALKRAALTSDDIEDSDIRYKLNKRLWRNALDEVSDFAESKGLETRDLSPQIIAKIFDRESKLWKAAYSKAAKKKVVEATEQRKEQARTTAANIVESRNPTQRTGSVDERLSKWNGKSAKDLLKYFK